MAISTEQKVDYLWKKLGYGKSKTDIDSIKDATNEANSSTLFLRGDVIWTQSDSIPVSIPQTSTQLTTVYPSTSPVECVVDNTSSNNRTWKTNIVDWIPPELGSTYVVKVYVHTSGDSSNAASSGVQLFGSGSGNNDEWFFDYQSGILNFIGDNLPNGIDFSGKSVYISGAIYNGFKGVISPGAAVSFSNLFISGISTLGTANANSLSLVDDLVIGRDVQINRNLNVNGNITVGGTTAIIYTQQFIVNDKEIVLGFTTDSFGNEVSNDNTANGGGISIASTEGTPLVDFNIAGVHTHSNTYKDIIWIKEGTLGAGTTDAWHFNYAVGIGSTQIPNNIRFAVSSIQFSDDDLAIVRNVNASGIITASRFISNVSTGTAPLTVASTTLVSNLNADTVDGLQASQFLRSDTSDTGSGLITLTNGLNVTGGSVGIGTDIPGEKLDVVGTVKATDFNTTSDQNLKTNIQTIENPLDKIVQIRGVNFEWKENNKSSAGVIAQEVEKVLPQLVNGEGTKTVNYNGLIGLLIEAVKAQQEEIEELKKRLG